MSEAVSARGVCKDFYIGSHANRVLHEINLDVRAGELTYLVGESGSGKTTFISVLAGILTPSAGTVRLFGTDLYALTDPQRVAFRLKAVGFVFQHYNLLPSLTAAENAAVPLIAAGISRTESIDRARTYLGKLGLDAHSDKYPNQLSGGQQQRIAIARALAHEPRIVVCDEPTAALDARSGRLVMDLLYDVAVAPDRVIIIVTHDSRIFDLADRIVEMEDGRIVLGRNQAGSELWV